MMLMMLMMMILLMTMIMKNFSLAILIIDVRFLLFCTIDKIYHKLMLQYNNYKSKKEKNNHTNGEKQNMCSDQSS